MTKKSIVEQEADAAYRRLTGSNPKVFVLPLGWCLHLFKPGRRQDTTFLARCFATGLFAGFSRQVFGWRVLACRINHIDRKSVIRMVELRERSLGSGAADSRQAGR